MAETALGPGPPCPEPEFPLRLSILLLWVFDDETHVQVSILEGFHLRPSSVLRATGP